MKKMVMRVALLAVWMLSVTLQSQAQSLGGLLKQVGSSLSGTGQESENSSSDTKDLVGSLLGNLIGTGAVSAKSLSGTWNYSGPAVAFESDNFLKKAGSALVSQTVEKKLQAQLSKLGFTAGQVKYTFKEDGTYTMTLKNKTFNGTYKIDGSTLTLTPKVSLGKSMTANIKVVGNQMQLTFKADKLLDFLGTVGAAAGGTLLKSVGTLAGSYQGMQMGLRFTR